MTTVNYSNTKMSNVIRPKRVIKVREQKPVLPKILPPMERPVTPRSDNRSISSARGSNLHNLSISRFSDLPELGVSGFEQVIEIMRTAQSTDDMAFGIKTFADISEGLANSGQFASCDLNAYHQLYPMLQPIVDAAPGRVLIVLVKALQDCLKAINVSKTVKPTEKPPTNATPRSRKGTRLQKLAPLAPLKEDPSQPPVESAEEKNSPTEHFYQFISKILYKMSSDKTNDQYFDNEQMVTDMIAMTTAAHKIDTRTYAVAALKNEAHSQEFRRKLIASNTFKEIFNLFNATTKKPQIMVQCTGLIRNIIIDTANLDVLILNNCHIMLLEALDKFPESSELVFNCFRILTKISERDEVRASILERFKPEGVLIKFIDLMLRHKTNHQILLRIGYVFADFTAYEPSLLEVAGTMTDPVDIARIPELLEDEELAKDHEVAAMLVQVIANLSVDPKCTELLVLSDSLTHILDSCTFTEDDRLGLNLLCTASNFTCHDNSWSPPELINAIPKAIVSKYIPSILEALRTLCNLALAPNTRLIDSKIPELLGILLKHVNGDVVLYSLQTLANLVNHAGLRRRFRDGGCVESLLELLECEEIDEMEMEAIAALVMNFGAISAEEANQFAALLDEFEIDPEDKMIETFRAFLVSRITE